MIKLLPVSSEQTISFIPRNYNATNTIKSLLNSLKSRSDNYENESETIKYLSKIRSCGISIVIVEDGTRKTQVIEDISLSSFGNFITTKVSINILSAESTYNFEIKDNGVLLYRDKIYCTPQISTNVSHTLNQSKYTEFIGNDSSTQKYVIIGGTASEDVQTPITLNYRYIQGIDSSISDTEYFYYPLFATQEEANYYDSINGGSGTSHTHTFTDDLSGSTWYMPTNGGTHQGTEAPTGNDYTEIPSTTFIDTDGDGIYNYIDTDDDGDGYADNVDSFPLDASEYLDTDSDGIGNNSDVDDDGDGQADINETLYGSNPLDNTSTYIDTDGDSIADSVDTDDDGDGQTDVNEVLYGSNPLDNTSTYADLDGDGIADSADSDRDGDGYANENDYYPDDATRFEEPTTPSFTGAILEFTTSSNNQGVVIGTRTFGSTIGNTPNYVVDWGDGTSDTITTTITPTHTYANSGVYEVRISGTFTRFRFGSGLTSSQRNALTDIKQWGDLNYETMEDAFKSCDGLSVLSATDTPTIGSSGKLKNMFAYSNVVTIPNLGSWDIAHISDFSNAFVDTSYPLDTATYDSLLTGWATQSVQSNASLNMGGANYTSGGAAEAGRNTLVNTYGWTFTDGGGI